MHEPPNLSADPPQRLVAEVGVSRRSRQGSLGRELGHEARGGCRAPWAAEGPWRGGEGAMRVGGGQEGAPASAPGSFVSRG